MARDWGDTESVRKDILDRMARFGDNIAEFQFSETLQRDPDSGDFKWMVDVHVKVRRQVEFELLGEGSTLAEALRRVYLGLNSEMNLRRNARTPEFAAA